MCFGCSKNPSLRDSSFECPLHKLYKCILVEKWQNELCTLTCIWSPVMALDTHRCFLTSKIGDIFLFLKPYHAGVDRDFPRTELRPNIGSIPIQKWAKTSQSDVLVYHNQFLSSTFWWKFNENQNKNSKVTNAWIFQNLHKIFMQIFMSFYEGHMLQLYAANFLIGFYSI